MSGLGSNRNNYKSFKNIMKFSITIKKIKPFQPYLKLVWGQQDKRLFNHHCIFHFSPFAIAAAGCLGKSGDGTYNDWHCEIQLWMFAELGLLSIISIGHQHLPHIRDLCLQLQLNLSNPCVDPHQFSHRDLQLIRRLPPRLCKDRLDLLSKLPH